MFNFNSWSNWLLPKAELTDTEIQHSINNVVKDGIASQLMGILTGSVFLVGLAVYLGASNATIGLLAAIPPLAQLVQIPAIYLVRKIKNRRLIVVTAACLARIPWLILAICIGLFPGNPWILGVLWGAILFNSIFGAIAGCSWNSWMRDLIPEDKLGSTFARKLRFATALGIIASLTAGGFLDFWKNNLNQNESQAYGLLFSLGFVAGIVGIFFISRIEEPAIQLTRDRFLKTLVLPFQDKNFLNLIRFSFSWNFAVNLAAPFFTVYMLRRLDLDLTWIILLGICSELMNLFFIRFWGEYADKFSNKLVLSICGPLLIICFFGWTFTTLPEKHILTLPLLVLIHLLTGISTAGVALGTGNIGLKLAPQNQATSYLVAHNLCNSVAAGIAPLIGGAFADVFAKYQVSLTLTAQGTTQRFTLDALSFEYWDFFFFFAFLLGLYSLHRLTMVEEEGLWTSKKTVIKQLLLEVRRDISNLSPFPGLRRMVEIPAISVKKITSQVGTKVRIRQIKHSKKEDAPTD
ncbi:MAG: MFS transporter [Patescibacteria group bacterium]